MKRITLLIITLAILGLSNRTNAQTVTDIDGNVYNTVTIGTQVWMKENLKVTKYNDGTAIPLVRDATTWENLTTPGYCWYYNDATTYKNTYGGLYNWYAVNTGKLAPKGWHVPTNAEWTTLETYLGGSSVAGGKLKETGATPWQSPNTGATNSSGFSAISGSDRDRNGTFGSRGYFGYWWSSTESNTTIAWNRVLQYNSIGVYSDISRKNVGHSVRCLRDGGVGIKENNDNSRFALYPNPSNGKFTITMEDVKGQMGDGKLAVYNVLGERVYTATHLQITKLSNHQIDLSVLPAGIYFLQVNTGEEIVNRKLVLEK